MQISIHPGRYRHYKGKEYTVIGVALHSETQEELVVYRQEYGDYGLWVRPKGMFLETVTTNGEVVPRFQYLGSSLPGNHQADKVLSYLNQRAFFPQTTTVPATLNVRSGSNVLGCHVLRNHPDAGWVVYFHGNSELAADCVDYCGDLFASAGVNDCFVEYRGYGQSDGEPALVAMLGDGEQVVRALGVPADGKHLLKLFCRNTQLPVSVKSLLREGMNKAAAYNYFKLRNLK